MSLRPPPRVISGSSSGGSSNSIPLAASAVKKDAVVTVTTEIVAPEPQEEIWEGDVYQGVDIWKLAAPHGQITDITKLDDASAEEVGAWLRRKHPPTRPAFSSVSEPETTWHKDPEGSLRILIHDDRKLPPNCSLLAHDNRDLEAVLSNFMTPKFLIFCDRERETGFRFDVDDIDDSIGFVHIDRLQGSRRGYSLGVHYEASRNATTAVIRFFTQYPESNWLLENAIKRPNLAHNPFYLPMLVLQRSISHVNDLQYDTIGDLQQLMISIGQHSFELEPSDTSKPSPLELDLMKFTTEVNRCSGVLQSIEKRYESQMIILEQLRDSFPRLRNLAQSEYADIVRRSSAALDLELWNWKKTIEIRLVAVREAQKNCQTQLAVLYNFIAQRDNRTNISVAIETRKIAAASKRDSGAMKTIAVLTILFLPGTFMAALFAMPLFNWQAHPGDEVVSGRFWVYWAFTMPLTAVVVLVWIAWLWWRGGMERREERDIERGSKGKEKGEDSDVEMISEKRKRVPTVEWKRGIINRAKSFKRKRAR